MVDVLRAAAMFGILAVTIWCFSCVASNAGFPQMRFDGAADTIAYGAATALGAMRCGMAAARTGLLGDPAAMQALWQRLTPWAPVVGVLAAVAFRWLSADGGSGPLLVALGITTLTTPMLSSPEALLMVWQQPLDLLRPQPSEDSLTGLFLLGSTPPLSA